MTVPHLPVKIVDIEILNLLLQRRQVPFAAAHAQFEFGLLSGVHGVLQNFVGVTHPIVVQLERFVQHLDLLQQIYSRVTGDRVGFWGARFD